ncbi:FAD-binding oxidoreductase [Aminobacter ciceronei]|uniref:FAD/FMN-containing dehydrogenase n=1 Tax=Aminobacter ciceronei TaxID=150723 RepID=A0ABR6BZF8_9HYPH|nr:FAD-binding oxidoreductase [Aminobacter ciceronei]MBA8904329.1 FAD/FMN-containing dehydrogenase [Aminobacter ciceronei]MBA9018107.1 FAD/FMN-containing dehydrogenase [Aminobacter ciceronei]
MLAREHIDTLGALLGAGGLLTAEADMAGYERGARYDSGRAAFVARPASTEAVSAVVAYCARHAIALVPQSGNTGLVAGSTPDATGTQGVLSLDRLRSTFELDFDNRSLRVDAGFRLSEINARLEPHGLFFPIDLGADPMAGGMVASNTGGARFLRFGDVRRNTLGMKVVLGDAAGTVVDFGAGLRKDNTGVDWKQHFIGTSGAFGVITECIFNLERLPQQVATAYLVPRSPEHVTVLLNAMEERLGTYLSAFEGMSGAAITRTLAHVEALRNPFPGGAVPDFVILAEVSRSWLPRAAEQQLDAVLEEVLADIWSLPEESLGDAFVGPVHEMWALRHALSEGVKSSGYVVGLDLSFRRGELMRFRQHMSDLLALEFPAVAICDFGHVGDGGVHFNLVVPKLADGTNDMATAEALRERVISVAVEEHGASFSAEHGLGRRNQRFYDRYTTEKLKSMAAQLKQAVAPAPIGTARLG